MKRPPRRSLETTITARIRADEKRSSLTRVVKEEQVKNHFATWEDKSVDKLLFAVAKAEYKRLKNEERAALEARRAKLRTLLENEHDMWIKELVDQRDKEPALRVQEMSTRATLLQSKREQENVKIANDALTKKLLQERDELRQLNSVAATLEAKRLRDLQVEEKKALTTHEKESDKSGTQQNPFLLEDANQEAKRKQQAMTATRTLLETQRVENARFKEQEEARKKKEKDDYIAMLEADKKAEKEEITQQQIQKKETRTEWIRETEEALSIKRAEREKQQKEEEQFLQEANQQREQDKQDILHKREQLKSQMDSFKEYAADLRRKRAEEDEQADKRRKEEQDKAWERQMAQRSHDEEKRKRILDEATAYNKSVLEAKISEQANRRTEVLKEAEAMRSAITTMNQETQEERAKRRAHQQEYAKSLDHMKEQRVTETLKTTEAAQKEREAQEIKKKEEDALVQREMERVRALHKKQ